eukprot:m.160387 g.160387  ORF g.160387 m.160387 type:complete len:112 (+) comp18023_c0_seq2:1319-1654(+)
MRGLCKWILSYVGVQGHSQRFKGAQIVRVTQLGLEKFDFLETIHFAAADIVRQIADPREEVALSPQHHLHSDTPTTWVLMATWVLSNAYVGAENMQITPYKTATTKRPLPP